MEELSLHILDIAENSAAAGATEVRIELTHRPEGIFAFTVTDNGCGMSAELLKKAARPVSAVRADGKHTGLGLPLCKEVAERTGGRFEIVSAEGAGTRVSAVFNTGSAECKPLGDIAVSAASFLCTHPGIYVEFSEKNDFDGYSVSSEEFRKYLGADGLGRPEGYIFVRDCISEMHSALIMHMEVLDQTSEL